MNLSKSDVIKTGYSYLMTITIKNIPEETINLIIKSQ